MLPLTAFLAILVTVHAGGSHIKGGRGSSPLEQKGLKDDHFDLLSGGEVPQPYSFDFKTDGYVKTSRQETGDPSGHVQGVYTLSSPRGHSRVVEYTANDEGFHADVVSSEPGIKSHSPANARYRSTSQLPISQSSGYSHGVGQGVGPLSAISPILHSSGHGQHYVPRDQGIDGGYFTDYGTRHGGQSFTGRGVSGTTGYKSRGISEKLVSSSQSWSSPAENPAQIFFSLGGIQQGSSGVSAPRRGGSGGYQQRQATYIDSGLGAGSYGGHGVGGISAAGVGGAGSAGVGGGGGPATIHFTLGGVDASTYGTGGAGVGAGVGAGSGVGAGAGVGAGGVRSSYGVKQSQISYLDTGVSGQSGVGGVGVGKVGGVGLHSARKSFRRPSAVTTGASDSYGGVGDGGPAKIHFTLGGVDASTYGSGGAGIGAGVGAGAGVGGGRSSYGVKQSQISYLDTGVSGQSGVGGVGGVGLHSARKSFRRPSAVTTGASGSYGGVGDGGPAKIHFTLGGVDASTYGLGGARVGGGTGSYGVKQSQTSYLNSGLSGHSGLGGVGVRGVGGAGLHSARKSTGGTSAVTTGTAGSYGGAGESGPAKIHFTLGGVDASTYGLGGAGAGVGGGRSSYSVKQSQTPYLDSGLSGSTGIGGVGGVGLHSARKTISRTSAVRSGTAGSRYGVGEGGPNIQFALGGAGAGVGGRRSSYGVKQSQASYLDSGRSGQSGVGGVGGVGGAGLHSARKSISRTSAVKTVATDSYGGIGESGPAKIHFTLGGVDASTYGLDGAGAGVGEGRSSYGVKQSQASYLDSGRSGYSGIGGVGVSGVGGAGLHSARKTISRTTAVGSGAGVSHSGVADGGPNIHFTLGGVDASTYGTGGVGTGAGGGRSSYGVKQSQTSFLDSGVSDHSGVGGAGFHSARKSIARTSAGTTGAGVSYGGVGESGPAKIHFTLGGVDASTYGLGGAGAGMGGDTGSYGVKQSQISSFDSGFSGHSGVGGVGVRGVGGASLHSARKTISGTPAVGSGAGEGSPNIQFTLGGTGAGVVGRRSSYGIKQSQASYSDYGRSGQSGVGGLGVGGVGGVGLHSARKSIARTSTVTTGADGSYGGTGESGPAKIHFTLGGVDASTYGLGGAGVGGGTGSYGVKQSQASYLDSGLSGVSGVGGVGVKGVGGAGLHSARKTITRTSAVKTGGAGSYGGVGESGPAQIHFTLGGIDASTYGLGGAGVGGGRGSYGVKQSQASYLDSGFSGVSGVGGVGVKGVGGPGLYSARKTITRTSAVKTGGAGSYGGVGESGPAQIHFTLGGVDASTYGLGGAGAGVGGGRGGSYGVKQSQISFLDSGLSGRSGIGSVGGVGGAGLHSARKTVSRTSAVKTAATGSYGGIGESGPAKIHFTLGGVDASTYGLGGAGVGGGTGSYGVKQSQASYLDSGLSGVSSVGGVGVKGVSGPGLYSARKTITPSSAVKTGAAGSYGGVRESGPAQIHFTLGGVDASTYGSGGSGIGVGGSGGSYSVKQSKTSYGSGLAGIGGISSPVLHTAHKRTVSGVKGGSDIAPSKIHFTLGGVDASSPGSSGYGSDGSYGSFPTSQVVKGGPLTHSAGKTVLGGAPSLGGGFSPVSSISPKAYISQTRQTVIASSTGFQGQRVLDDGFSGSSPLRSNVHQAQIDDISFTGQGRLPGSVYGTSHSGGLKSIGAVRPISPVTKITQEAIPERYSSPGHIQFTLGGNQIFPGARYSGKTRGLGSHLAPVSQRTQSPGATYLSQTREPIGASLGGGQHPGQVQLKVGDRASDFAPISTSQLNVPLSQVRDVSRDSYDPSRHTGQTPIQFTIGDQQAPLSSRRSGVASRPDVSKVSQIVTQAEDVSPPLYGRRLSQSQISYDSGLGQLGVPSAGHHVSSKYKPSPSHKYNPRLSYVAQYPYDAPDDYSFRPAEISKHLGGGVPHGGAFSSHGGYGDGNFGADVHRSSSANLGHQGSGVQQVILADHAIFNSKGSDPFVHEQIAQERLV